VNERRYLPWLIAAVLPVIAVLWWRGETPPAPTEAEPKRTEANVPEGLERIPTPPQAPQPPDYYQPWPAAPQVGRFEPAEPPVDAYRFRPLNERERRRMGQPSAGAYSESYGVPRYDVPQDDWGRPPPPTVPRDYGMDPMAPEPWQQGWGSEGYSFRPVAPSSRSNGRWQGPYSAPRPSRPYPPDAPPPVDEGIQWGATPRRLPLPSRHLYPALDRPDDRRLTAR
jgi:hypothetical protein